MQSLRIWTRRIIAGLLVSILVLVGIGFLWQTIGTSLDRKRFPAPGQLVDVGGHKLHVQSQGESGPVIILETGHGTNSTQYAWLMPELAKFSRVYAYDRAGYGWSEEGDGPWSMEVAADELYTMLRNAGIEGPYILVSHSLGGLIHRTFAAKYPEQVAGLVLLDPTAVNHLPGFKEAQLPMHKAQNIVSPFGVGRIGLALGLFSQESLVGFLPAETQPTAVAMSLPNKHWRAALREFTGMTLNDAAATLKPEIPVTVLSANKMEGGEGLLPGGLTVQDVLAIQLEGHAKWVAESLRGRHIILDGADHLAAGGMNSKFVPQIVDEIHRMTETVTR